MAAKKTKLFILDFDYEVSANLEYAWKHLAKFEKEKTTTNLLKYRFNPKAIAEKWSTVGVVVEKGCKADVYILDLNFAVSKKVKTALEKQLGETVEFLPVQVVGEMYENADDEMVCKPKSSKDEIYLIHPTAKIQMAAGTKSEDYPGCREYLKYAFRADDISDLLLFRPPQSSPRQTLVSQAFRDIVKAKKIKGFSFPGKVDWQESDQLATKKKGSRVKSHVAVKSKGSAKSKDPVKSKAAAKPKADPPIVVAQKFYPLKYGHPMTKGLWKRLQSHWNWVCDASIRTSEDKPRRPKISKPISQTLLKKIKKTTELPREFEQVLTKFSAKVDFFWSIEPDLNPMPEAIEACTHGGGPLWDAKLIPEMAKMVAENKSSQSRVFWEALEGRLPFIHVGNGDLVAFCMRKGIKDCPIVYLSHDNDDRVHNRRIGINFVDFIVNWTNVGCIDIDMSCWEPFYSKPKKKVDGFGRNAARWRKYMETGK